MGVQITCPNCGASDQAVGQNCQVCGVAVNPEDETVTEQSNTPEFNGTSEAESSKLGLVRLENGVFNHDQAFEIPEGSRLLVGRTDPVNGVFPEVDVTMWSKRVPTPDGPLYTIHRKQCFVSRDEEGRVWIVDHSDYVGDTMVSPAGAAEFRSIPTLADERESNEEGAIQLEIGDRVLMGQGEGMLIFQLTELQ